jgi:aminoglycoside 2'-N-acetyltransferase I
MPRPTLQLPAHPDLAYVMHVTLGAGEAPSTPELSIATLRRWPAMAELRVAHTSALDHATLDAARTLLAEVFEGDFDDDDWEHALGGMHALLSEQGALIGHASLVQRRLLHGGRALRAGYVEGVGVRGDVRRRGHGATLMRALEQILRRAYDVGALGATSDAAAFYRALGWQPWRGPCSAMTPDGVRRTPEEEGSVFVLACAAELDLDGELTCDWRGGDVW